MTFAHNLITASPYDYRDSISAWWRSLFILQPNVEAVQGANTVYQVHAIIAWLLLEQRLGRRVSRNIASNSRAGSVGTQFASFPSGAFGPK